MSDWVVPLFTGVALVYGGVSGKAWEAFFAWEAFYAIVTTMKAKREAELTRSCAESMRAVMEEMGWKTTS